MDVTCKFSVNTSTFNHAEYSMTVSVYERNGFFCWDFNFHSLTAEPLGLATELLKGEKLTGNSELEGSSKCPKHSPSRGTGYSNLPKRQKEKVLPWKVMGRVTWERNAGCVHETAGDTRQKQLVREGRPALSPRGQLPLRILLRSRAGNASYSCLLTQQT